MSSTSTHLAAVALGVLLVTAGCADVLTGEGPLEFDAEPVIVSDAAVSETGYELETNRPVRINRTFEFQDEERRVEITNHAAVYEKRVQGTDGAFFIAFSTPKAEMAGQTLNPIGRLDTDRLLERVASQRAEVRDVERTGSFDTEVLDAERTIDTFSAVTDVEGQEVTVTLHIARFTHEDDVIVAVGGYPEGYDGRDEVVVLMQGIEHPAE